MLADEFLEVVGAGLLTEVGAVFGHGVLTEASQLGPISSQILRQKYNNSSQARKIGRFLFLHHALGMALAVGIRNPQQINAFRHQQECKQDVKFEVFHLL